MKNGVGLPRPYNTSLVGEITKGSLCNGYVLHPTDVIFLFVPEGTKNNPTPPLIPHHLSSRPRHTGRMGLSIYICKLTNVRAAKIDLQTDLPSQNLSPSPHQNLTTHTWTGHLGQAIHGNVNAECFQLLLYRGQNVCDTPPLISVNIIISNELRLDLEIKDFLNPSK